MPSSGHDITSEQHTDMPLWFGKESWCPATDEGTQVETPVEQGCFWCDEPISEEDFGYLRTYGLLGELSAIHRECDFRSIMGGVNHMRGLCSCKGGNQEPDPPEMTKREAAIAAWDYYTSGTSYLIEIQPP